ncbi:hypothetical protein ILUMI_09632 [Ignelater luminosus]|uniref:Rac GTPase-activating protein 1 n=1 Tax=Ignelater luminosus TaxID=2038154 RepID=A0A8K0D3U2_IGNLU|nr:hypothetical protein ILUMI_09632 [Ignelater luminosus]
MRIWIIIIFKINILMYTDVRQVVKLLFCYTSRNPPLFKTPKSFRAHTAMPNQDPEYLTRDTSDSEESTKSDAPSDDGSYNSEDLSIVAEYDELMRNVKLQRCNDVEDKFLDFVEQVKGLSNHFYECQQECQRLNKELEKKAQECSDLESKLVVARKFLDQERRQSRKILEQRDALEEKIARVVELLFKSNQNSLSDEVRQQLAVFNTTNRLDNIGGTCGAPHLSTIHEANTTGSLLSDLSYSRSEDDLDMSTAQCKTWKKHRPSMEPSDEPAVKKRRSGGTKVVEINPADTVRATTTLTVAKDGPITATSVIEAIPPEPSAPSHSSLKQAFKDIRPTAPPEHLLYQPSSPRTISYSSHQRQHVFQTRTTVIPENCSFCEKRIGFGRTAYKCKDCRALAHPACKSQVPLPCIPCPNTPTQGMQGVIGDYTPAIPPMVPPLIVHCIKEIESRGLNEIGIYRVPGSEKDVKALKERFLRGRGVPCLSDADIHVVCGTVKNFLRSLLEPLIPHARWADVVRAVESKDKMDVGPILYQIISELPQPNQDTLAYMIMHLKRVASSPNCKMPVENLARVFGPTIVGYSSSNPNPSALFTETEKQRMVMENLINLPNDYWESFVNNNKLEKPGHHTLQQTPSTDSLLGTTPGGIFTPQQRFRKKKQRLFPTPT